MLHYGIACDCGIANLFSLQSRPFTKDSNHLIDLPDNGLLHLRQLPLDAGLNSGNDIPAKNLLGIGFTYRNQLFSILT